jgi:hypothetical protein
MLEAVVVAFLLVEQQEQVAQAVAAQGVLVLVLAQTVLLTQAVVLVVAHLLQAELEVLEL